MSLVTTSPEIEDTASLCLAHCISCHQRCLEVLQHCIERGGRYADPAHLRLLQDCADICLVNAHFLLRHSPLQHRTSAVCAELCQYTAASCEKFAEDTALADCAELATICEASCQHMTILPS